MVRSSVSDSISWIELSRPTVSGRTAWGNSTVSRTGNTGIRRMAGASFPGEFAKGGGLEGVFVIECPFVNFSSLDSAEIEKFQDSPSK
jgi:hypothetical protein